MTAQRPSYSRALRAAREALGDLNPEALAIAEAIYFRPPDSAEIEPFDVSEEVAKALYILQVCEESASYHHRILEHQPRTLPNWLLELQVEAVLTYHPTPNYLYGCAQLDAAIRQAVFLDDIADIRRGVAEARRSPLRNLEIPDAAMLGRFTHRFGDIIRGLAERGSNIRSLAWTGTDADGNDNVTAESALRISHRSRSGRHMRFGADEVLRVFHTYFKEPADAEGWNAMLMTELNQPSRPFASSTERLTRIISDMTSEHNIAAFVISECENHQEVWALAIMLASYGRKIPVCPLLEREHRIAQWKDSVRSLLSLDAYRAYIEQAGGFQMLQVGPSDTAAHAGVASLLGIGHNLRELILTVRELGVRVKPFVGAGRNLARGGGQDLRDLAFLLPRLEGLVDELTMTVQGGQAARCFGSETAARYQLAALLEALSHKSPHDEEISHALADFAARASQAHEGFNGDIRNLCLGSPWYDVVRNANLSDRPLKAKVGGGQVKVRAILLQQLLGLIGGESLLFAGWNEAWRHTPPDQAALLRKSNRFARVAAFGFEATELSDFTAMQACADSVPSGWLDNMRREVDEMRTTFRGLIPAGDAEGYETVIEYKRRGVSLRTQLAQDPMALGEATSIIVMQYILLRLGRLG